MHIDYTVKQCCNKYKLKGAGRTHFHNSPRQVKYLSA